MRRLARNRMAMKVLSGQNRVAIAAVVASALFMALLYAKFATEMSRLDAQRRQIDALVAQYQKALRVSDHNSDKVENDSVDNRVDANKTIIIYNRVPKTGSTSFMGIAYDLCAANGFNVLHLNTSKNSHVMSLSDQFRLVANATQWRARQPALIHGHIAFVEFEKFGAEQSPIYINIIRKPLERLVSYYYFLRNGDNFRPYPAVVRRRQGDKVGFDECVRRQERDCHPDGLWLQIPFFCGHVVDCWVPGNEWALQQAKRNLVQYYFLVGVTEQLREFVAVLDASLPQFFRGALSRYDSGLKSHLRITYNKVAPLPETVAKIQRSKTWKMENEFYEFAVQQFNFIKQKTLTEVNGHLEPKSQQFFYEKIRPR